jgi:hypothetical protein
MLKCANVSVATIHKGWFTPWTMKSDHGRWSIFMVQFLRKLAYKAFGPSLGVSRMWTKRNDHAPKRERVDFFNASSRKKNKV